MNANMERVLVDVNVLGISIGDAEIMTATEATAEVFYTAFRTLSKREREAVVEKLLEDKDFMEDLIDIVILEQRQNEPSRLLDEYI